MSYTRESTDTLYRGNRRWSGNFGKVWVDGSLMFEIKSFEAKITLDREDVIIGQSKDSKVTSLTGEGTITILKVFNRGFSQFLENIKKGYDVRVTIVAALNDADMLNSGEERIKISNVWFNDIDMMHFTKGEVVETEMNFGFTPEDAEYLSTVEVQQAIPTLTSGNG